MVRPRSLASAACLALLSTLLRAQGKLIFTNSYNKAPDGVEWAADVDGKTARVDCSGAAGGGRQGKCCSFDVSYCPDGSCYRSEVKHLRRILKIGREFWFGFALMLPRGTAYLDPGTRPNILHFQLHGGDNIGRGPVFGLKVALGDGGRNATDLRWNVTVSGDDRPSASVPYPKFRPKYVFAADVGAVRAGAWEDFVVSIDLQYTPTGRVRVWKDGHLSLNRSSVATAYNDHNPPYVKTGTYVNKPFKTNAAKGGTPPKTREWGIRYWQLNVADAHSSFAQVSTMPHGAVAGD